MTRIFLSRENGKVPSSTDFKALEDKFGDMRVLHNFTREENIETITNECKGCEAVVLAGPEAGFYEFDTGKELIEAIIGSGINKNRIISVDLTTAMNPKDVQTNTELALIRLDQAIHNANLRKSLEYLDYTPERSVLIIGSDPSGILLASHLLDAGIPVTIISRGEIPSSRGWWDAEYKKISGNKNCKSYPFINLKGFSGVPGKYTVEFEKSEQKNSITCGSIAIATAVDLPYNQDIHTVFHIPINHNKELIPLTNGNLSFRTRYQQVVLLPAVQEREPLQEKLNNLIPYITGFLAQDSYRHFFDVATVNEDICGACGTCVKTCMFSASSIDLDKRVSAVDKLRCVGCGNCVTACPTGARELHSYPTAEIFRNITFSPNGKNARGMVFACEGSGYTTLEDITKLGVNIPRCFSFVRIRCGARLDTQFISEAMNNGYKGVAVICCKESKCLNDVGSLDLSRRFNLYRAVLRAKGIDANLLRIITIEKGDTESCSAALNAFAQYLEGGNNG